MTMPKVSQDTVASVIVGLIVFTIILWAINKYFMNPKPDGALSESEYNALSAEQKALYTKNTNGWYVKA